MSYFSWYQYPSTHQHELKAAVLNIADGPGIKWPNTQRAQFTTLFRVDQLPYSCWHDDVHGKQKTRDLTEADKQVCNGEMRLPKEPVH